jgi:hypothetical protein
LKSFQATLSGDRGVDSDNTEPNKVTMASSSQQTFFPTVPHLHVPAAGATTTGQHDKQDDHEQLKIGEAAVASATEDVCDDFEGATLPKKHQRQQFSYAKKFFYCSVKQNSCQS